MIRRRTFIVEIELEDGIGTGDRLQSPLTASIQEALEGPARDYFVALTDVQITKWEVLVDVEAPFNTI